MRRILQLGRVPEISAFLEQALALVVSETGTKQGYLEIEDRAGETDSPVWPTSHSCSSEKVADIRGKLSRGIIAQARASGEIVSTASALLDPRFEERTSVQAERIDAVLCAPLGGERVLGVVYLQGATNPARSMPTVFAGSFRTEAQ